MDIRSKSLVVLRYFKKQFAQCGGVSFFESAQSLVLIYCQHNHGGLPPAGNLLRFACERSVHQGAELVLRIL